jgi:CHC2 zinc finger/AAA domain
MSLISAETIEQIKQIDVHGILSQSTDFKKVGNALQGLCCFHDETTPSLTIYPNSNSYYCFGCQSSGDVITAYQQLNGVGFQEAVSRLAQNYSINIDYQTTSKSHCKTVTKKATETVAKTETINIANKQELESNTKKIVTATEDIHKWLRIALPNEVKSVEVITYIYSETQKVIRYQWQDQSKAKGRNKTFRPFFFGNKEGWLVGKGSQDWPAYKLNETITEAVDKWVLGVEGEKCVDSLREKGISAITWQGGSWDKESITFTLLALKDHGIKGLIYIADNDIAGQKKAQLVKDTGKEVDFPVITIDIKNIWQDSPEAGDIYDYLECNQVSGTELLRLLKQQILSEQTQQKEQVKVAEKAQKTEYTEDEISDFIFKEVAKIGEMEDNLRMLLAWDFLSDKLAKMGVRRTVKRLQEIYLETLSNKPFDSLSFGEFAKLSVSDDGWLVENLIRKGAVTLLAADPKVGKSLLHYDLSFCLANGLPDWCGFKINQQAKVLIIQTDESLKDAQDRVIKRGLNECQGEIVTSNSNNLNVNALKKKIENDNIDFVVVDSLISNTMGGGCTMNDIEFGSFMYKIKDVASETGASILLIHHYNKSNQKNTMNKLAGGFFIGGSVSCALGLDYPSKGGSSDERILTVVGSRYHAHKQSWKLELECLETNSYSLIGECTPDGADIETSAIEVESPSIVNEILSFLKKHAGNFFTSSQIADSLKFNAATVRKYLGGFEKFFNHQVTRISSLRPFAYGFQADKENLSMDDKNRPAPTTCTEKTKENNFHEDQGSIGSLPKTNAQNNYPVKVLLSDPSSDPQVIRKDQGSLEDHSINKKDKADLLPQEPKPLFNIGESVIYKVENIPCRIKGIIKRSLWDKRTRAQNVFYQYIVDTFGEIGETIFPDDKIDEFYLVRE